MGRMGGMGEIGGKWKERGDKAVAVADEPYLAAETAEDDGGGGEALLGVRGKQWEQRASVVLVDVGRYPCAELVAGGGFRHVTDVARRQLHSVAAIAADKAMAMGGLRCGAVDDGYEVRGDDDAVLAFLCRAFRYECLFDDLHGGMGKMCRAFRGFRIFRVFRIVRILRFFRIFRFFRILRFFRIIRIIRVLWVF